MVERHHFLMVVHSSCSRHHCGCTCKPSGRKARQHRPPPIDIFGLGSPKASALIDLCCCCCCCCSEIDSCWYFQTHDAEELPSSLHQLKSCWAVGCSSGSSCIACVSQADLHRLPEVAADGDIQSVPQDAPSYSHFAQPVLASACLDGSAQAQSKQMSLIRAGDGSGIFILGPAGDALKRCSLSESSCRTS